MKQQYTQEVRVAFNTNYKGDEVIRLKIVFDQLSPFVETHISELKHQQ